MYHFVPEKRCFVTREAKKRKKGKEKEKPSSVLLTEGCEFHTFAERSLTLKTFVMATPIASTPPLKGQDAVDFLMELEKQEKVSSEEMERINAGAERIAKMIDFNF